MELKDILRKVDRVKFGLMTARKTTFFSALLASMRFVYDDSNKYAATDGITIWMNPDFVATLDEEEILGLLLHELGHSIFEHIIICFEGKLNPEVHNIAGDHYINLWLLAMGYVLPRNVPAYADKQYIGWSTMKIYLDLMKNPQKKPKNYIMDIKAPPKNMSKQEHVLKITNNIMKAVIQAEMSNDPGSIPDTVKQLINRIRNPELPWNALLANYMDIYAQDDYSWSRPNKRFLPDFYMPTLRSLHMGQMTVGMDVSGSTTGKVLSLQFAEVKYIWDTVQPQRMHLMTFDVDVHLDEIYNAGDLLDDVEIKGGGGTKLDALFKSIRKEDPVLALIFTDGHVSIPDMTDIESDIIWIITGNSRFTAPKGKIIHCNV